MAKFWGNWYTDFKYFNSILYYCELAYKIIQYIITLETLITFRSSYKHFSIGFFFLKLMSIKITIFYSRVPYSDWHLDKRICLYTMNATLLLRVLTKWFVMRTDCLSCPLGIVWIVRSWHREKYNLFFNVWMVYARWIWMVSVSHMMQSNFRFGYLYS